MAVREKWEYLVLPVTQSAERLNQLGDEGWELRLEVGGFLYFKRKKAAVAGRPRGSKSTGKK